MAKRRGPRRIKPYLLPECNIEYARGVYQSEGSFYCHIDDKRKRAKIAVIVAMEDQDALKPLEPCFGTNIGHHGFRKGKRMWRIVREGTAALPIAQQLAVTPERKRQINEALEKCRKAWEKGYHDRIP